RADLGGSVPEPDADGRAPDVIVATAGASIVHALSATAALLDTADTAFGRDVLLGLSQPQKRVPCTWLYDHRGSELFEDITLLPEYYPTRAEMRILARAARHLARAAGPGATLVEFGSGGCRKTPLLLSALASPAAYVLIDISARFLRESVLHL